MFKISVNEKLTFGISVQKKEQIFLLWNHSSVLYPVEYFSCFSNCFLNVYGKGKDFLTEILSYSL